MFFKYKKILWAFDVYAEKEFVQWAIENLESIAERNSLYVEPVHVVQEPFLQPIDKQEVKERFSYLVRPLQLKHFLPPKVINARMLYPPSYEEQVDSLLDYAKTEEAIIAIHTTAKTGLNLVLLGSFAEALLHQSEVPVVVLHAHDKKFKQVNRILAPVSMNSGFEKSLTEAAQLAKLFESQLFVYHVVRPTTTELYGALEYGLEFPIHDLVQLKTDELEEKCHFLKDMGLRYSVIVEETTRKRAEAINIKAKELEADIIAMPSKPHLLTWMGSTAIEVIRGARRTVFFWNAGHMTSETPHLFERWLKVG